MVQEDANSLLHCSQAVESSVRLPGCSFPTELHVTLASRPCPGVHDLTTEACRRTKT